MITRSKTRGHPATVTGSTSREVQMEVEESESTQPRQNMKTSSSKGHQATVTGSTSREVQMEMEEGGLTQPRQNMNPSSSRGHPAAATGSTSREVQMEGEESESTQPRQSMKRSVPSSSSPTGVITSPLEYNFTGDIYAPLHSKMENPDFICFICKNYMSEPMIAQCGHTHCLTCIFKIIGEKDKADGRCPQCGTPVGKSMLTPNRALIDSMARVKQASYQAVTAPLCPDSISPPTDAVKLLTSVNYDHLNLNDLDRLLLKLHRQREIKALHDEEDKQELLNEFLFQLLKAKSAQVEHLKREVSLINRDVSVLRTSFGGSSLTDVPIASTSSSSKDRNVESFLRSSEMGSNTQPLQDAELENQSLAARKKRIYNHFNELTQVYFDCRNAEILDNRTYDAIVPNGRIDKEDMEGLEKFGRALSHITQYHALKPLATLCSSTDIMPSNSNIVSSIEFDKDNEFFAIAGGVMNKIKLFEYVNVIGSPVDIHCPSAQLSCNAETNCVAWNNYYKNNLASSDHHGCVSLWDVATSTRVRSLVEHETCVWSVDWSNGDPRLLASGSNDSKVKLWSTNSERSIANLEAKAPACCVKFCPESSYLIAFGSADHCVYYYDFRHPKEPLRVLCGHIKAVSYIKFASKQELVSASIDGDLKLWKLESMSCTRSFSGHINEKNFIGLATDGNYIACGSENNSLYLYCKFLPKPLFSFKLEHNPTIFEPPESPKIVTAVTWKPGSPIVVAGNSHGTIKILELI